MAEKGGTEYQKCIGRSTRSYGRSITAIGTDVLQTAKLAVQIYYRVAETNYDKEENPQIEMQKIEELEMFKVLHFTSFIFKYKENSDGYKNRSTHYVW